MALYKNNTGEVSRIGYTVKQSPNDPHAFVYANAGDNNIIGIITQAVPKYAQCEIATSGITKVFCYEGVVAGAIIRAQKTTDRISRGTCKSAKSSDTPYFQIGTALESGKGLVKCQLNLSGGSAAEDYVPYTGAYKDVNIGDHFLTGRFIARPGEAAANLAPLIFQTGTLLTAPEAGTMEFDGTGIYLTPTNHRRFISLASDSLVATQVATTIAPTLLWTGITNANELKPHRVYVIKACGLYNADAVEVATITLDFGVTTIGLITTPVGVAVLEPWHLEIFLTIRTIGAAGTISAFGKFEASTGANYGVLESFVLNTTIANDLKILCSWSNVGQALGLTQAWLAVSD
jgi:hypothetical protein